MDTKICSKCRMTKPITEFRFINKAKGIRQYNCTTCCREIGKNHYATNKAAQKQKQLDRARKNRDVFLEFKRSLSCVRCGESSTACLDFHHIDPARKEFSINAIRFTGWDTVKKELSKCVCVCSNCHRKIHAEEIIVVNEWVTSFTNQLNSFIPDL